MNTSALIMMVVAFSVVTFMTLYYFIKVLRTPPRDPEHDSYTDTK
jgi:hypothetical protein